MWNCGGDFVGKITALLASHGDADALVILETHLQPDTLPNVPGYRLWLNSRSGGRGGGIAVLAREDSELGPASLWRPSGWHPSPYHLWLRFDGAHSQTPLYLAAAYVPPASSRYSPQGPDLEDWFTRLGDEVAEAMATHAEASVLLAADLNAHLGTMPDWADHSVELEAALPGELAQEMLAPCATQGLVLVPRPRASECTAPVCKRGEAVVRFCHSTGMLVANGRVEGDMRGSPTCFSGSRPSLLDIYATNPACLARTTALRVLEAVPEYLIHRPVEMWLTTPVEQPPSTPTAPTAEPQDEYGPPPSLPASLRIDAERLPAFAEALGEGAVEAQLRELAQAAEDDPLQAITQLHAVLYDAAAAVLGPAPEPRRRRQAHTASALRRKNQPWFDEECQAAREAIRWQMRESVRTRQPSHLAKEALRAVANRYNGLRRRKVAEWQRKQGTALLHLQRKDQRAFFRRWKQLKKTNPISAARWLRHHVDLQARRAFRPTGARTDPRAAAVLEESATPPQPEPDVELDADITTQEVTSALRKLKASSGSLGPLSPALIKAASRTLAPILAKLFTAVFRSGRYPPEWALGVITSLHKKGDPTDPNNYRGITIGHTLARLYAAVVNARLASWLEARGLRATGQAGFRQGYRTIENCFVLRALMERARANRAKLYCCAVDFEKAFDSVDRPVLWAALRRSGIGGTMLAAIQAMYAEVTVSVRTEEGLSGTFRSVLGVKQGCPLSPLLFGILLDDFETGMQAALGDSAALPRLAGRVVPPLLFADDCFLISTTVAGLQAQLGYLQAFSDARKLTVNAKKTQVLIFRPGGRRGQPTAAETFTYAGAPLTVAESAKYLGLTLTQCAPERGLASCADMLATAGRHALHAMRRRAKELGACTVEQQCSLFDIFVKPVLSYGCEVWAVDLLARDEVPAAERVHRWFCRRLQGLPRQASSPIVLHELGRLPLHLHWVQQVVRFWNHMQACLEMPDRPLGWALTDNLELQRSGADCWCSRWLRFLGSTPTDTGTFVWLTQLRESEVLERACAAYLNRAMEPTPSERDSPNPRSPCPLPSPTRTHTNRFARYISLIRGGAISLEPAPHLYCVWNAAHRAALSRFRASCHDLRIERERYLPAATQAAPHARTCLQCASPEVEDETHMVFRCPIYDHLRFEYADLFPPDAPPSLDCFLSQDQTRVAAFIHACKVTRCQNA